MNILRTLALPLALGGCLAINSCARSHASNHLDPASLLGLARSYSRQDQPPATIATSSPAQKPADNSAARLQGEQEYRNQIMEYLAERNFTQLESAAREARAGKGRVVGGLWKLFVFYEVVTKPVVDSDTEDAWMLQFDTLKQWISVWPASATARIAMAGTYENFAYHARGTGYATSVSDTGWQLYGQRIALEAEYLAEASRLKDKDPFWFEAMQHVALAQGWDKSQAKELTDLAYAFEPEFYHYYREYANFLLPKWYGEEGEAEAFAEEISKRLGGKQGAFVYFEIASVVTCQCDSEDTDMERLSWPKIKEGYEALGQLYGYSYLKVNRFAHMAFEARDRAAGQQAFALIKDNWDPSVWRTSERFESAKQWAMAE